MCVKEKKEMYHNRRKELKVLHDGSVQPQNVTEKQMKKRKVFIPTKKAKHAPDIFDVTNITQ